MPVFARIVICFFPLFFFFFVRVEFFLSLFILLRFLVDGIRRCS
jgi:hypothetical protein